MPKGCSLRSYGSSRQPTSFSTTRTTISSGRPVSSSFNMHISSNPSYGYYHHSYSSGDGAGVGIWMCILVVVLLIYCVFCSSKQEEEMVTVVEETTTVVYNQPEQSRENFVFVAEQVVNQCVHCSDWNQAHTGQLCVFCRTQKQ